MRALALLIVALLLAGCADDADPVETAAVTPAEDGGPQAASDTPAADNATAAPTGPGALYMLPDGALSETPPTEQAFVPLDAVANSPATGASPEWAGAAPVALDAGTTITLKLYLTTSSASIPARTFAGAFGFPGIGAYFSIGENSFEVSADGPDVLVRGDVSEIQMVFEYPGEPVEAGTEVHVEIIPYYSHVQTVADVQFVMGPEHLAGLAFDHAAS